VVEALLGGTERAFMRVNIGLLLKQFFGMAIKLDIEKTFRCLCGLMKEEEIILI
jgi:hypothetical protein